MSKKTLKDYTPEQLWKLERRLMAQDIKHNPESERLFVAVMSDLAETSQARADALRHKQAQEEMGRSEYFQWSATNPLSPRAQIHLRLIEQELAAPAIEHGRKFTKRRKGAQAEHTKEIYSLAKQYLGKSAKELQALATHPKAKKLSLGRFATVVSEARKTTD